MGRIRLEPHSLVDLGPDYQWLEIRPWQKNT
jgi:hypothetical protein